MGPPAAREELRYSVRCIEGLGYPRRAIVTTGHRITIERSGRHVRVVHGEQVLAESERPLVLLTPSGSQTYCPFKGTASYWSLPEAPDLVWAYPDPKPDVAEIKDHLCFYEVEVM
jgi:uncharacterized protein (DUF427 family)